MVRLRLQNLISLLVLLRKADCIKRCSSLRVKRKTLGHQVRAWIDHSLSDCSRLWCRELGEMQGIHMTSVTRKVLCAMLVTIVADTGTAQQRSATEETSGEVLAVDLRRQGHRCDAPVTAERDAARSKPDEAAWVLKCANASFRMRLVPHMAAVIEQLD